MTKKKEDFDKWMDEQGALNIEMPKSVLLTDAQIKILKNYPECETANDLPFNIQEEVIALNDYDNATSTDGKLQNEVDAFLMNQYSLLTRNFQAFITKKKEPVE
jgi:hypothetical protein|tara:strand:- start:1865 stop:2176 length:312 start_codon:yes stop_codon:yes gene_type:complete